MRECRREEGREGGREREEERKEEREEERKEEREEEREGGRGRERKEEREEGEGGRREGRGKDWEETKQNEEGMNEIFFLVLQIPLGIGISVTIRVGKELGAGNPRGAKRASFTAVAIARKDVPRSKESLLYCSGYCIVPTHGPGTGNVDWADA